ncbi:UNVERIFIED_CONTAM: hypothetical protein GTU68_006524 [Idotea baltica]|nr:hypothetical protein [Idotea baltica]
MAQRGYQVSVYERRGDMRLSQVEQGRSINLALSDRGLQALRLVDIDDEIKKICIPMHGRLIHDSEGRLTMQPYSGREGQWINSVSRSDLNRILIEAADRFNKVHFFFNQKCLDIDLEYNRVKFQDLEGGDIYTQRGDVIFGADGAGSALRKRMERDAETLDFQVDQSFLAHGYKELSIPPTAEGDYRIDKNVLHIWPRGTYMLIALPNLDGSFTVTLFLPYDADPGFNQLKTDEEISAFFNNHFADVVEHMPQLVDAFKSNPTGPLGTVRCYPWQHASKSLLIGDSAHAIVPFYGQGMNCAFEDVYVLDQLYDTYDGDWSKILTAYQAQRKPNTDAIAELALENYIEMRDQVADPAFALKRQLEMRLESEIENYYSKYSMVTFRADLSYTEAANRGHDQNDKLLAWCRDNLELDIGTVDLETLMKELGI